MLKANRIILVGFIFLAAFLAGVAFADANDDLRKGLHAYQQRDYATALAYLRPLINPKKK